MTLFVITYPVAVLLLALAGPAAAQALMDENGNPIYYDHYGNPLYGYGGERVYYYDWDAESRPRRIVLAFNGERYTASPYAGYANRGANAYLGKVFYTFSNIPSLDGKWVASGNVYLYGWECRLGTYVNPGRALMPPTRVSNTPNLPCRSRARGVSAEGSATMASSSISRTTLRPRAGVDAGAAGIPVQVGVRGHPTTPASTRLVKPWTGVPAWEASAGPRPWSSTSASTSGTKA